MKIVFATNNQHKLQEIRQILGDRVEVLSLKDIGCDVDIPETGQTLEENALQKARYIYDHYHMDCFADDTGLEVEALDGAPGIYSARYASMESGAPCGCSSIKQEHLFEGIVNGEITTERSGAEGFGYDPIFRPDGFEHTFADMTAEQKNGISHRGRATAKLADYLLK